MVDRNDPYIISGKELEDICSDKLNPTPEIVIPKIVNQLLFDGPVHVWELCSLHVIVGNGYNPDGTGWSILNGFPAPDTCNLPPPSPGGGGSYAVGWVSPNNAWEGGFDFYGNPLSNQQDPSQWPPWINNTIGYGLGSDGIANTCLWDFFYDWVASQVGQNLSVGDKIVFDVCHQQVAWYIPAGNGNTHPTGSVCGSASFGLPGQNWNKVCLVYKGRKPGALFISNFYSLSTVTQMVATAVVDQTCCFGESDQGDKLCYNIGDITDPADGLGGAGGMVFAIPNTFPNNTPYYYEVALDDLSVGTTPVDSLIIDNVFPFTQTAFSDGQRECGHGVQASPVGQLCFPISLTDPVLYPIDTTIDNMHARYPYSFGGPTDPCNPSGPPPPLLGYLLTNPNLPVIGVDFNNNSVWPSGANPILISFDVVNPNSATSLFFGFNVTPLPYTSWLFEFDTPMNNPTSALYLKQLTILGAVGTQQPFSTTGAEWGAYNDQLFLPTSVDFGEGLNNTNNILAQPATPVWSTHGIAADLCLTYNPPSSSPHRWFLPSLMEFHAVYTNVGPGTPYAATLNLHPQLENLQDTYWTSSSLTGFIPDPTSSATTPPLIGGPNNASSNPFAWAYNTHDPTGPYPITISQNLPIGPNVITRCSTLSVRPVRRFECVQPIDPIDLSCDGDQCDAACDGFFAIGNTWGGSLNDLYFFGHALDYDNNSGILVATQAQLQTDINNSGDLEPGYTLMGVTEISRFGNRLWIQVVSYDSPGSFNIDYGEWITDTSQPIPTIFFNRLIKTSPSDYVGWGSAVGSGLDNCTFLIARRYVGGSTNLSQYDICTVDVSGVTAVITSLFTVPAQSTDPGAGVRDVAHVCDTESIEAPAPTYIYTNRPLNSPTDIITHVDSSGAILGSVPIGTSDAVDVALGVCCFNGEIFVSRNYNSINELYSVDLSTYTLGSTIFNGIYIGDLASNPICCPGCCGTESPSDDPCDGIIFGNYTQYVPGDIGPAGGIVVAVPYMNVNDPGNNIVGPIIQPLQGQTSIQNPTKYYYEISPTNLNSTSCALTTFDSAQWGLADNIDIVNLGNFIDYWTPENNYYQYTGGFFSNEFIGEGYQATYDMIVLNMNVMCGPPSPYVQIGCGSVGYDLTPKWAFEMCGNFSLNSYTDWFLPTTREMQFARNYTPPGTLYDSTNGMAVVNSYGPAPGYEPYYHYWTCNTDGGPDISLSGLTYDPLSLTDNESAFTVSMEPISPLMGSPDGENWRTKTHRCHNNNVRAMRRFECDTYVPPQPGIEYNYREGKAESGQQVGWFESINTGIFQLQSYDSWDATVWPSWGPGPPSVRGLGPRYCGYSTEGWPYTVSIKISKGDIAGNTYKDWDFGWEGFSFGGSGWNPAVPEGSSIFISVWDLNENFIGKWEYFLGPSQVVCGYGENCYIQLHISAAYDQNHPLTQPCNHIAGPYVNFNFDDPAHVPINYPSGQQAGKSLYYIRLEVPASPAVSSNPMANTEDLTDYGLNVTGSPYSMRFPTSSGSWISEFPNRHYQCDCSGPMALNSNGYGGGCNGGTQINACAPWLHAFACDSQWVLNNFTNSTTLSNALDCGNPNWAWPGLVGTGGAGEMRLGTDDENTYRDASTEVCESSSDPFKPLKPKEIEELEKTKAINKKAREEEENKLKEEKENGRRLY